MKRTFSFIAAAFLALTASAEVDVGFTNIVGVVQVESTNHNTLVAIPFTGIDFNLLDPEDIAVAKLIPVVNLSDLDRVSVYDEVGGHYMTWRLRSGAWKPVVGTIKDPLTGAEIEINPNPAGVHTVSRGWALLLYRQKPTDESGKAVPFYLTGQYSSLHGSRTLEAGTATVARQSLVSFPGLGTFDLNTIEGCGEKDEIFVIGDGVPRKYTLRDGKWGYNVVEKTVRVWRGRQIVEEKSVRKTDDTLIARGEGFWYMSFGSTPTITW